MDTQKIIYTAKHILNMLVELPIGIILFTFAVTGLSLSVGLLPLFLLGIPVFIAVMGVAGFVYRYEMTRCHALLQELPEPRVTTEQPSSPKGLLNRAMYALTSADSWKGIVIMIVKLPLGIISFTVAVTLVSLSLGLLAYPLIRYILLEAINEDIYETNLLALFTDLGAMEQSLIYFGIGLIVSYGVVQVLPAISKAFLRVYAALLKI